MHAPAAVHIVESIDAFITGHGTTGTGPACPPDTGEHLVLSPGTVRVQSGSAHTHTALATLALLRGWRCVIVPPPGRTAERPDLLRELRAEVVERAGIAGAAAGVAVHSG